jgi:uncharacterized membrane protein YphA (DoxX/SURF4 family)
MTLSERWNNFWFADAPYFDLAVMRIACVAFQCFFLLDSQFGAVQYVLSLPADMYHPPVLMWALTGGTEPWTASVIYPLYWITVLAGFAALVGLLTNASMVVFSLCNLYLQLFIFSFGDYHHPEAIMVIGLLALALSPCGKLFSVDNLIARFRGTAPVGGTSVPLLDYKGPYAGWPIKFIQCFFPLMYISAAVAKVAYSGYSLEWANGYTLQYYFIQDDIRKVSPLALWASQWHTVIFLGQITVLFYQMTYFLVVPYPKLRWIYLPIGMGFHLANYLIIKAPFPQWILFLLVAYIPWSLALKKLYETRVLVPSPSAARETTPVEARVTS